MNVLEILNRMDEVCPFRCSTQISPVEGGVQLIWDWSVKDKYDKRTQFSLGKTITSMDIIHSKACPFECALDELSGKDFKPRVKDNG